MKKIVLKKEAISNLNNGQMNKVLGGKWISARTFNQADCNSVDNCCTMYVDCKGASYDGFACITLASCGDCLETREFNCPSLEC